MKEHFKTFLTLLKAYPKATLFTSIIFSILMVLIALFYEGLNFGYSLMLLMGSLIMAFSLKVVILAEIRNRFISPVPLGFFGFLFLMWTFLSLIAGLFIWPVLLEHGKINSQNNHSEGELERD